jgi:hypothetical protein
VAASLFAAVLLTGCARSPTFNILGSFFPAWLVCLAAGTALAAGAYQAFIYLKLAKDIPWSIVVYPCIAIFFACTFWLICFS